MKFKSIKEAKETTGLSYIGMVNNSVKHVKAYKYNEMVYTIYLAPADSSGYEVCKGRTEECTAACLNLSGRNRMDIHKETINRARIKKTKLIFEENDFITRWIAHEIILAKAKAERKGYRFSVRLNNTSDISPETFCITENGETKNLLQLFPDVQFYDYTKIPGRITLLSKYPNYDLTFSYNGYNEHICKIMLKKNIRVAVVFLNQPETFWGYPVIDGDLYDMRYQDDKNSIIGLSYKKVRTKLNETNKFVIQ